MKRSPPPSIRGDVSKQNPWRTKFQQQARQYQKCSETSGELTVWGTEVLAWAPGWNNFEKNLAQGFAKPRPGSKNDFGHYTEEPVLAQACLGPRDAIKVVTRNASSLRYSRFTASLGLEKA
ncbi:unnamed protein product [Caenorhabditis auriculariae]|uniref:Uncharacterized protein n=1 Tax=Caenorhabditis auriculariae TaxID=2777116 RepID=A0A8S1HRC0_9PELO|nr:unnamed protein product [Caenorhabditis auriculariae]